MIVYEDEASFRQTPTLYRTWARRGQQPQIPTRGERHTQKILGAVSVPAGDFVWRHQTEYFNAQTYLSFLDGDVLPHYYRRRHRVYLRAFGWQLKKADRQRGKEIARQQPSKRLEYAGETAWRTRQ